MKSYKNSPKLPPVLMLILGIFAVSTSSILVRYAQKEVPSLVIATYRLTLSTLILGVVVILRNRSEIKSLSRNQWFGMVCSGLFLALHFATWITSLEYTSITSLVVLVCSTPLWVALLSPIFIGEKPGKWVWGGMTITLVGAMIVGLNGSLTVTEQGLLFNGFQERDQARVLFGNFLALMGAFSETGYILIGRGIRQKTTLISYTFLVYGSAALILLVIMGFLGLSLLDYSPTAYFWMTSLAIVPQLLGHTSFNWALGYLNAAFVSVAMLGEPVGTSMLSYLIFKIPPTGMELVGGILILVGISITSRSS